MEKIIEKLFVLILVGFGLFYSIYLSVFLGDYFVGFIFILITAGLSSTIYILDKKINYRIIFYIWLAIVVVALLLLLLKWSFEAFSMFKI
jgi:hypothetical protein